MRFQITRTCYLAGEDRAIGDVVECARNEGMPAVAAGRAVVLPDEPQPDPPAVPRRRPRKEKEDPES